MMKWLIGLVLVVVAGAGLWWSGLLNQYLPTAKPQVAQQTATTTPQQQTTPAPINDLPTQTSDTSDAAMAQDTAAVDAQMQGLQNDSASIDQSFNDKATAQEY
ncbi:MAG TPA: hypothetical protein VHD31_01560 [Candidatus Paceibacterota bacterium]|nr:hypothetical protein [Candidatus Paceibacterota bacterium]